MSDDKSLCPRCGGEDLKRIFKSNGADALECPNPDCTWIGDKKAIEEIAFLKSQAKLAFDAQKEAMKKETEAPLEIALQKPQEPPVPVKVGKPAVRIPETLQEGDVLEGEAREKVAAALSELGASVQADINADAALIGNPGAAKEKQKKARRALLQLPPIEPKCNVEAELAKGKKEFEDVNEIVPKEKKGGRKNGR